MARRLPRIKLQIIKTETTIGGKHTSLLNAVTQDGLICPFLMLSSGPEAETARRIEALWIIRKDLELAKSYWQMLEKLVDSTDERTNGLKQSLWQSSVVTYARCFVDASPGRSRLSEDIFDGNEQLELKQAHGRAINLRHKYFAHSEGVSPLGMGGAEYAHRDAVILHVALNPDENRREIVEFYYRIYFVGPDATAVAELSRLIDFAMNAVVKKITIQEERLLTQLETSYKIEALYEAAIKPNGKARQIEGEDGEKIVVYEMDEKFAHEEIARLERSRLTAIDWGSTSTAKAQGLRAAIAGSAPRPAGRDRPLTDKELLEMALYEESLAMGATEMVEMLDAQIAAIRAAIS